MPDIPLGLSLSETDDGFILHRKDANNVVTSIAISKEELFGLQETIASWTDRTTSEAQAKSGQVQAIVFQPVAEFGLSREALGEHLLLTLVAPSGGRRTFGLPPQIAADLSEHIPEYLDEMRAAKPTQQ